MILLRLCHVLLLAAVLCLGVCCAIPVRASSDPFATGNTRYAAGDFADAARDYEKVVHDGRFSANLFFNLGNTYHRAGDKGRAVLNYRRALALEPGHAEAAANLAFVGGGKEKARGTRSPWWRVTPWLVAACGWLGAAGLLTALASRRRRALGIGLLVTGSLLCAAGSALIWQFDDGDRNVTRAVVIKEAASALYSPTDSSKVVTSLAAGSEVRVLSEQGAWEYVLLADGTTRAWLASGNLESFVPR